MRPIKECHATSKQGRSRGGQSDLPRRADSSVALHLFGRRGGPSSKEGRTKRGFKLAHYSAQNNLLIARHLYRIT